MEDKKVVTEKTDTFCFVCTIGIGKDFVEKTKVVVKDTTGRNIELCQSCYNRGLSGKAFIINQNLICYLEPTYKMHRIENQDEIKNIMLKLTSGGI